MMCFVTCQGELLIWYVSYMGGKAKYRFFYMDLAAQTFIFFIPKHEKKNYWKVILPSVSESSLGKGQ